LSEQASSVQTDRSALGALAAFLATGAAASLSLFPILIVKDALSDSGEMSAGSMNALMGWALAFLITGVVAAMTTKPLLHQPRNVILCVAGVVVPLGIMFSGNNELAFTLGGCALVGSALAITLVEWALGLSETEEKGKSGMFQLTSGREASNPIPSVLVLGVLIFAWPGRLLEAGWVAAPFFGFVLMLASLGGMFSRVRQASSGVVAVHPKFLGQWFVAGVVATLLCAAAGYLLPVSMGQIQGIAERKLGGPVDGGPFATKIKDVKQEQPRPDYNRPNDQGLGDKNFDPNMPAPSQFRPQPLTPEEIRSKLILLLGLAALAAALLWLVRRYHAQILAFFRWLWAVVAGPFVRAWRNYVENKRKQKHEAAVRAVLASIDDPFADPPASLTTEDLRPLYDKMVADLALLGAKPRPDESALAFVRRVATVYSVDKESLFYLGQVMTEATFSPRPVTQPKLESTRERFLRLRKQVHEAVAPQQLPQKQEAYRWALAESKLPDEPDVASPSRR
jgi:hypothetical protein